MLRLLLPIAALMVTHASVNTGPTFELRFGGQAYAISIWHPTSQMPTWTGSSADIYSGWVQIAGVDMETYRLLHRNAFSGVVRGTYVEGTKLRMQTMSNSYMNEVGFECPAEEKCDGTCEFDSSRQHCYDWDNSRIFIYDFKVDGIFKDNSSREKMAEDGWEIGCLRGTDSRDATYCSTGGDGHRYDHGGSISRMDSSFAFYEYTFSAYVPPSDCTLTDFGDWQACGSGPCGGAGSQSRTRTIIEPSVNGGACPEWNWGMSEHRACTVDPCPEGCTCNATEYGTALCAPTCEESEESEDRALVYGDDGFSFANKAELEAWCDELTANCKACGGKDVSGGCKTKSKKINRCKVKDQTLCKAIPGCKPKSKKNKKTKCKGVAFRA